VTLAPLLDAPAVVQLHALAAVSAFALGAVQFAAPKGTLPHRALGWVWVALMLAISLSSFAIQGGGYRLWRGFGPIHLLSIFTLVMLAVGIVTARRRRIKAHRITMISIFIGALVIAGLFTLVPGRLMHQAVFGQGASEAAKSSP
jgi:uncharacterized membrane protein